MKSTFEELTYKKYGYTCTVTREFTLEPSANHFSEVVMIKNPEKETVQLVLRELLLKDRYEDSARKELNDYLKSEGISRDLEIPLELQCTVGKERIGKLTYSSGGTSKVIFEIQREDSNTALFIKNEDLSDIYEFIGDVIQKEGLNE